MYKIDTVHALVSTPANDLNFVSCLKNASSHQIERAIEVMRNREGMDKGRIGACERELRRRKKS